MKQEKQYNAGKNGKSLQKYHEVRTDIPTLKGRREIDYIPYPKYLTSENDDKNLDYRMYV